jgi:hypothetical protein
MKSTRSEGLLIERPIGQEVRMNEPFTTLDPRFSDPDAVATRWDESRRALEHAELFWITTVRADGRLHVTPLVAVWLDDAIHFKPAPQSRRRSTCRRIRM